MCKVITLTTHMQWPLNVRWMAPGGCLDMLSRNFVTMFSMLSEIVSVDFAWIKYKILKTTGAGYCTTIKE